jgi:hypothetical protein
MTTEKKKKEEKFKFSTTLMLAGQPTVPNGEIYTHELIRRLVERFTVKPYIIVQEMNPVEREAKKIPLAEPWSKKVMANVVSGELVDGKLIIHCETRLNRDGRKLAGIIQENGIESVEFFPVGYGVPGPNGVIAPNYQLNYVAVEPKKV